MNTPAPGLPPCARCAQLQKTCCQRAEILVTRGDVARIQRHVGSDDFHEHRAPRDPAYTAPDPQDPNWVLYTVRKDGMRHMLKRRPNGDCTFLQATGCVLPESVRPLVCRLYPYSYNERELLGEDGEDRPKKALAPDGRSMLAVLDIQETTAEHWRRQLYQELRHGTP